MTTVRQVEVTFPEVTWTKDLTDDQVICDTCHGVGLILRDYPYGLSGERRTDGNLFPYNNPFVGVCPDCYFGVRTICLHCKGVINPRVRSRCDCDGARAARDRAHADKMAEKLAKRVARARKLTLAEAQAEGVGLYYSEGLDRYLSLDELVGDLEPDERKNLGVVWACDGRDLHLVAGDFLENAAENQELHEDAVDSISRLAVAELQAFLDKWCEAHTRGTRTYTPDYKRIVLVPPVETAGEPDGLVAPTGTEGEL